MTEDWQPLLADLAARRESAAAMGGPEKIARRTERGRGNARAWLELFLDEGSFTELGLLAGEDIPADGFVAGTGLVDGRPVVVGAEDGSVAGGSIGVAGGSKRVRLIEWAARSGRPLVWYLDGAGHRATNALRAERPAPNDLQGLADLSGQVPIVTVVGGPSAGHGALAAPLSDYCILVRDQGALFTAGPPLVAAATGHQPTVAELGGAQVHAEMSGVVDVVADDDAAAAEWARRFLSFFPSATGEAPPRVDTGDLGERDTPELLELIPVDGRRPYDMRPVIATVCDDGSTLEVQPDHGRSVLCTLGRLAGHSVGIVANQPQVLAGSLDVAACEKAARFLTLCGTFGLPVVFLADNPGVLAGVTSERAGILRAAARMFRAQRTLTGPKLHLTIRKAFGFGSSVMAANPGDRQSVTLALPTATLGGIPAAVGASTSKADEETTAALTANESAGPWRLASAVSYDDVISPVEVRSRLLRCLELFSG